MGGTFCFSTKTEYTEDGVVRFLFLSFSTSQDWPTIGTRIYQRITNACIGNEHLCFFVLLVFVYCYHCLGKALSFY